jgi:flagellar basal-body rod modification protein FlgD
MKSQSPLKPFDSSDMMQQMSQLTSLSATQELEKTIKSMNANMGRSQVLAATQLIGKKVAVASDKSPLDEKEGLSGSVIVPGNSSEINIEIRDSANKLVKTIKLPGSSSGVVDFHWDGLDAEGKPTNLPGFYNISAKATINGEAKEIYTAGIFKVNSVTMDRQSSSVILNVDGLGGMDMGDIIKILS